MQQQLLEGRSLYAAVSTAFTPGATPDDVFTITGSATKVVEVVKMGLTTVQTTAGVNAWFIRKRSTANSGGTSASAAAVPMDSKLPAATATALQYTADPTLGTSLGDVWSGHVDSPAVATAGIGGLIGVAVDFLALYGQPVRLRGITEVLAWNFNNAALPAGLSVLAYAVFSER